MTVKSFQAKISCQSPAQREWLELTHRLFNEHLPPVVNLLYAALRGKHGPEFQRILSTVKKAQGAKEQIEAISSVNSKPGQGGWKEIAKRMLASNQILFDRFEMLPGFSSEFRRKIFETAFQIILSHKAKRKAWQKEHEDWIQHKAEWEAENPEYMQIRHIIQQFAEQEGKVSKRRGRWHRWLTFLSEHPELAAWRGGPAIVHPLTEEELAESLKQPRKAVALAFEYFFSKNPELEELNRLDREYDREFVRSWAKRRNADGFKHSPTFTLPSPEKHPAWFSFKKGETYRKLNLSEQTIELKVLTSADSDNRSPRGFEEYRFHSDSRLNRLQSVPTTITSGREKCNLLYHTDSGCPPRPASVKGIKLVFRSGQPYLYFTVYVEDSPGRISIKQESIDKYAWGWVRKKIYEQDYSPPLRTMAIDLGIRHIAAATIMEGDKLIATRFIHNRPTLLTTGQRVTGIPTLQQIAAMKRELRRRLRLRGKPTKGRESCRELGKHIRQMSEDRFKKSAAAIVDFARAYKVDLILMENLAGLAPDAERERGINRALINWNRGQLCSRIKLTAEGYGIRIIEIPPYWTSQICSRCDHFGQRYSVTEGKMSPQPVGKLFGCPYCGYRSNADFNASINLHRVWLGTFPEARRENKGSVRINGQVVVLADVRAAWEEVWTAQETPF